MADFNIVKAGWLQRQSSILRRWKRNWFVLYQNGDLKMFESADSHYSEWTLVMKIECLAILSGEQCGVTPPEGTGKECLLKIVGRGNNTYQLCADTLDDMTAWKIALEQARVLTTRSTKDAPPTYSEAVGTTGTNGGQFPYSQPQTLASAPPYVHVYQENMCSGAGYSQQHTVAASTPYPQQQTAAASTPYPQQQMAAASTPYPRQQVAYSYPGQVYYGSNPPPIVQHSGQQQVVYVDGNYYPVDGCRRRRNSIDGSDVALGMVAGAALGSMMFMPLYW
ncbi:pleckstrin homology domain-containing family B member 2 isoform X2 [Lingula anatina]|uniref:Pleckstrin homology domain-containing family B member 2 isoform X2 n=1 Tax=Lingula anatina TaxID=7574 RepID=A0A1S3J930_LINAN|nr:pleckstrin homology domain-containing family B member 2 isoform X2 [Lingula anatina]|eukprot:XP_013406905.1 pleckstrin homology domain-containing family B member 2 isoform X2 [Lingula anatina]